MARQYYKKKQKSPASERIDEAKAVIAEKKAEELLSKVVPASEVKSTWSKMVLAFRSKILNMPNRLAMQLVEEDKASVIQQIIKKSCYEALNEIASNEELESLDNEDCEILKINLVDTVGSSTTIKQEKAVAEYKQAAQEYKKMIESNEPIFEEVVEAKEKAEKKAMILLKVFSK